MPLIATPGAANANSYITVAEADAYFETHLYGEEWIAMDDEDKEKALYMAARLLDQYDWKGLKANNSTQALRWPRSLVLDREGWFYLDSATIPVFLKQATAELARYMTFGDRDKAVDALMSLLSEHSFEQIGLAEVAGRAGIKLSQLRAEFGSTLAILGAHIKEIDRVVLAGGDSDMAEEPARQRLFDVLMRRLEALAPYRDAVRSIMRSARRNPGLAFALNAMAVRSQRWMLEAAGIGTAGPRGALRAQGAALMFARVLSVWIDDDDEGLDRTMAALDRGLASAERWAGFLDDLCAIPGCVLRGPRRRRRRRDEETEAA